MCTFQDRNSHLVRCLTPTQVNPELKSVHVFPIERKQKRSLARALSRGMKMTLWHHKALWKDNAIGTAVVKAEELENKAEVCVCACVHACMCVCVYTYLPGTSMCVCTRLCLGVICTHNVYV